jgi:hypothetical protein
MNYSKPEVKTLGQATTVIEGTAQKIPPNFLDGVLPHVVPAYDLDE